MECILERIMCVLKVAEAVQNALQEEEVHGAAEGKIAQSLPSSRGHRRRNVQKGADSMVGDQQRDTKIPVKQEDAIEQDPPTAGRGRPARKRASFEIEKEHVAPDASAKKVKIEKEPLPVLQSTVQYDFGDPCGSDQGVLPGKSRGKQKREGLRQSVERGLGNVEADSLGPTGVRCFQHRGGTEKCNVEDSKAGRHQEVEADSIGAAVRDGSGSGKCDVNGCTSWGRKKVEADSLGPTGVRCFEHGGGGGKCTVNQWTEGSGR